MTGEFPLSAFKPNQKKFKQILDPDYPLCREDVVWMLEYIKKKVADADPAIMDLSQPRLLRNFHYFAEASMSLIHRTPYSGQEADRLRGWLAEAAYGLLGEPDAQTGR